MAGRIPADLIDTIRVQADVVDIISDYVTLKKSGKNYLGLCPFHNEKTPSFNVNPEKQIFHCFGCGKGGNVFTFLVEHEKINFVEAVRYVAGKVNITLPETARDQQTSSEHENLARVTQFAARFFHDQLLSSDEASTVRQYIVNRGISDATVHEFSLGYAPDAWDGLLKAAKQQDISPDWLQKTGLAKSSGDRFYDTFRNRLIFPIYGISGRVVGFGGRALSDEDQPKYLNSPETSIYQKSRIVYGLYQTKDTIRKEERVLIVEGYMDLLSLHQAGIEAVIATCGTSLTREHARLIARYAKTAVLLYDADTAGSKAAMRGLEPLVEADLWTRVVQLPEGEDPDTYVKTHKKEGLIARIDQANTLAEFISSQFDTSNTEEKEEALRTLAGIINKVSNPRHRERYLEEAEQRLPIPQSLMAPMLRSRSTFRRQNETPQTPATRFEDPERELVRLMLLDANVALTVEEQLHLDDFKNPAYRIIVRQRIEGLDGDRPSDPASLIDNAPDEETARIISELVTIEDTGTDRGRRVWDYILRMKQEQMKVERTQLKKRLAEADQANGEGLDEVMKEMQALIGREQALLKSQPPF